MSKQRTRACWSALIVVAAVAAVAAPSSGAARTKRAPQLYAAAKGHSRACTASAPCTLARAIAKARPGSTVRVQAGRYEGGIRIAKRLRLLAEGRVVIDASTSRDGTGIHVVGPGGSGSLVEGFTVENAKFEGILVGTSPGDAHPVPAPLVHVTIRHNVVKFNDTGEPAQADGECKGNPPQPGDCGEGLHLVSTTHSIVEDNLVMHNAGGILVTDEFGPTAHDKILRNRVLNNHIDCGITLAGHNPNAADPTKGGVYANLVEGNVARHNGNKGEGGGVLLGGGAPGSGVYDNVIRDNTLAGNGVSGITIHQHFVGNLNGNVIEDNTIERNNLLGDEAFAVPDESTTGILVAAGLPPGAPLPPSLAPSPITGTIITGNTIAHDSIGIWTYNAPGDYGDNTFDSSVATPMSAH